MKNKIMVQPNEKQKTNANMQNYDEATASFKWSDLESEFSWKETGNVNIVYEAIDRACQEGHAQKVALHFSSEEREEKYTYEKMKNLSTRFAKGLQSLGIKYGDRVFIFLPRTPEYHIAILGTLRIGAIAGPLFEAFMEKAVQDRLEDSEAAVLITTPELLERVNLLELPELQHVILVGAEEVDEGMRQVSWQDLLKQEVDELIEWVGLETPMLMHYTSGSTGKPKGVLLSHKSMMHMLHAGRTVYDLKESDVYWCVADPGWITGTSAGMWAPWLNRATVVMIGGRFDPDKWYKTIEKYKVSVWFSAPTAFRMLMAADKTISTKYNLSSLRHILSAGEPLNPELVQWGIDTFGLPIYDNWWMTETGSTAIANYPTLPIKPGSMGKPLPGIKAMIVNNMGMELEKGQLGNLALAPPWPGLMHSIWNNNSRFDEYFVNGLYFSGDSAYIDEDGYYWFEGRVDDVINTMGERVGPFEVESKLVEHPAVSEAGVIGIPDPVRGEAVKAYITLRQGYAETEELLDEIMEFVKHKLAAHARPRVIEVRNKLPKTRSGKIMRRVLKARELDLPTGDVSTIDD